MDFIQSRLSVNLEQSGSAPMVTTFISNSLVGKRGMSARGKPYHHNTATSKGKYWCFIFLIIHIIAQLC